MTTRVQKWGHSFAVRIPCAIAQSSQLTIGAEVDVEWKDGAILIVPAKGKKTSLADLLKGVTKDNLHGEVTTGSPIGSEVW
ncbi:MAG: AbrB/MazE/SpoVT family DNA-binding domain-containing protein [Lentisphaeria bacterium]|jgi:antitoxin MazE